MCNRYTVHIHYTCTFTYTCAVQHIFFTKVWSPSALPHLVNIASQACVCVNELFVTSVSYALSCHTFQCFNDRQQNEVLMGFRALRKPIYRRP